MGLVTALRITPVTVCQNTNGEMKHVRERLGKHCGLVRLERCKTKLMLVCRGFLAKKRICFTSGFLLRNVFCNSVSEGYRYRFFFFRIDSPQNTGTADTDSKILCAEYPELSVVLSCKPAVSRDIALRLSLYTSDAADDC